MECSICGKTGYESHSKKFPNKFCSYSCYDVDTRNREPNCECAHCGKKLYFKPSRVKKLKWNEVSCSKECASKIRAINTIGEKNHQFGLKGDKNGSFKNRDLNKKNHRINDIYVYDPENPNGNRNWRVLKHRKVVEDNYELFEIDKFYMYNGKYFLQKKYDVHHINENHDDNRVENLSILTRSEHKKLHTMNKILLRDNLGRITGVLKKGELLGNLEAGNQQPSLSSNTLEGSTTNVRDLSENSEVGNNDTSALPLE